MNSIPSLVNSHYEESPKEIPAPDLDPQPGKILFINFEIIEDYHSVMRKEDWVNLFSQKKFNFRKDKLLFDRI